MLIVLSENSIASPWVEREVNAAREREQREGRSVLFPVRLVDSVVSAPQPWAAEFGVVGTLVISAVGQIHSRTQRHLIV